MDRVRVCSPTEAAELLEELRQEWRKLSETNKLELMYVLQSVKGSYET